MDLLGGISTAASAIGNLVSGFASANAADKNYQAEKENLDWQKQMQMESWRRDDNAIQRRAADMAAAGINPLLAAGSAAGNAPVVHTEAPQLSPEGVAGFGKGISGAGAVGMALAQMQKDFAVKDAQIQNLQAQSHKTDVESHAVETLLPGNVKLQTADLNLKDYQAKSLAFDVAQLKPAEVKLKTQEIANKLQEIKQSEWYVRNGSRLTDLQAVRDRNEQMLRSAGISESNARLAAMAVELEILKTNRDVAKSTVGARSAGAYTDLVGKMDMVKMLGMSIGDPQLFNRIKELIKK